MIYFYPRSPCGERHRDNTQDATPICISIHALLAESDRLRQAVYLLDSISIHALLAESDLFTKSTYLFAQTISIHALLAESDPRCKTCCKSSLRFLSTLSLRRATRFFGLLRPCLGDFYPRSPCGERLSSRKLPSSWRRFLSTLSLRRATAIILPARGEHHNFYPRSPCGERQGGVF